MTKRLLATGVTGFVGAPCLRALLASGFDEIHAVTRGAGGPAHPHLYWRSADLRDQAVSARLIAEIRPTHLFHAAWIATPGVYLASPENGVWAKATIAMVRAFAGQGGRRLVGVGSSAEYGPTGKLCAEDSTPLAPVSPYGAAKAGVWAEIQDIAGAQGMEAVWGRLFTPYGPGSAPERLIPVAIAKLRAGEPVPLAVGEPLHDFVYTPDAARMLAGLMTSSATGAFNIGSGEARTVRSVIEAIADHFNMRDRLRFKDLPPRPWEPQFLVADMAKLAGLGRLVRTPMAVAFDQFIARRP